MFVIIFAASLVTIISGFCDTEETLSVKHYFELGCQAVQDQYGKIQRFNCPDFMALDKEKCHFNGKVYETRSYIETEYLNRCEGECFCGIKVGNTPAQFVCNYKFCPEQGAFYAGHCIFQRSIGNCCADNIICGDEKLKDLHKCYVQDQTYHHGERMFITRQCHSYNCICDVNFDERNDPSQNSNCVLTNHKCDLQLRHLYQFQQGCAPVYFGQYPTCPEGPYRCPKLDDRVLPGINNGSEDDVCTFGQLTLRKGDRLDDSCYNCTCVVPPMLICRQYENCEIFSAEIAPISF